MLPSTAPIILLSIPFNEAFGALVAPDASGKNPAAISAGQFVSGRYKAHAAAYFPAEGRAEIIKNKAVPVLPVTGIYTLCVWLKAETQLDYTPTASWVLVKFSGKDRFLYLDANSPLTSWTYFAITFDASSVSVFVNARLVETRAYPEGWGKPTGWCLLNDNPSPSSGFSTIEDLTIYDGIVGIQLLTPPIARMDLNYFVNGVNFRDYGVYVSESEGTIDKLAMKEPFKVEWDEHHGEVLDLSRPRFQPRDITLSCFIQGVGKDEFLGKVQTFMAQWMKPGTQRLQLSVLAAPQPLVYEVYCPETVSIKKRWSDELMVGTFELKLREPQPIKRVLKAGGLTAVNLFDKTKVVEGKEVRNDGTILARSDDAVTDYIPVVAGTTYTISGLTSPTNGVRLYVWLASDKATVVGSVTFLGTNGSTLTAPAGASYLIFSLKGRTSTITTYDTVMMEVGTTASPYAPYGGTYSITLTSPKALDIYWGDGTSSKTIYGTNRTITHAYPDGGKAIRYIIIAGVIEEITNFSSSASLVWSKL